MFKHISKIQIPKSEKAHFDTSKGSNMFKHISEISMPQSEAGASCEFGVINKALQRINYKDNHKLNNIKKQETSTKKFFNKMPIGKNGRVGGGNDAITHRAFALLKPPPAFFEDPQRFLRDTLTRYEFCIFNYMDRFKKCKDVRVFHNTIARAVGCDRKTVVRAMKTFRKWGLMVWEPRKMYQANQYYFSPYLRVGAASFLLWLNTLSGVQQEQYMMHNILPGGYVEKSVSKGNVPLYNINVFNREYIYKNSVRGRGSLSRSYHSNNRYKPGWVVKHVKRGSVMASNIDKVGWTPVQSTVASRFELSDDDRLKLVAFSDSCLESVMSEWKAPILKRDYGRFIEQCKAWLQERSMKPDYEKYKRLVASLKTAAYQQRSNTPDTKTNETFRNTTSPHSPYAPYRPKIIKETFEQKARRLKDELDKFAHLIENPPESAKVVGIDFMVKIYRDKHKQISDELHEHIQSFSE